MNCLVSEQTDKSTKHLTQENLTMAERRRIVLLGKTGSGKSSLANTIFGEEGEFRVNHSASSGTKSCQSNDKSINGRNISLVDTPGFFDTDPNISERSSEILKCVTECAPGPHAFLIVLKVEKYTVLEKKIINMILKYFSKEALKFTTVVFTRGDDLQEGVKIEDWVRESENEALSDLVQKCGGRCHVFDNKYWRNSQDQYRNNTYQVQELIKTIDKTVTENGGKYYTNKMLEKLGDEIQQEMKRLRATTGEVSEKKLEKMAKQNVFEKFWNKMKGYPAGILLGAFLGLGVMIPLVVLGLPCIISGAVIGAVSTIVSAAVGGGIGHKISQPSQESAAQKQEEDEQPLVQEEDTETELQPEEIQEMWTQARLELNELSNIYKKQQ